MGGYEIIDLALCQISAFVKPRKGIEPGKNRCIHMEKVGTGRLQQSANTLQRSYIIGIHLFREIHSHRILKQRAFFSTLSAECNRNG
jgi:hypothetical protein